YVKVAKVRFTVAETRTASADTALADLTVDGATVAGFDPETTGYAAAWAAGAPAPVVAARTAHPGATVEIVQPTEESPVAQVTVTAADRVATATYTVTFARESGLAVQATATG